MRGVGWDSRVTLFAYGLAGVLAHGSTGTTRDWHFGCARFPSCLLDCILAVALEVFSGSACCFADCPSSDSSGLLRARGTREQKPAGALVGKNEWSPAGV